MGVVQDDWSCTRISSQICLTFIPHSFNCSLVFLLLLSYICLGCQALFREILVNALSNPSANAPEKGVCLGNL